MSTYISISHNMLNYSRYSIVFRLISFNFLKLRSQKELKESEGVRSQMTNNTNNL